MSSGLRGLGRREETADPLAFNPRDQSPDRSIAVTSVRNPGQSGGTGNQANSEALVSALGGLQKSVMSVQDQANDTAITEGKVAFMQGKTLAEVQAAGNTYTTQGYQTLGAVDEANKWFAGESIAVQKDYYNKTPEEYNEHLRQSRAEQLKNLPADPAVRKAYVAAYEDAAPRLAAAQIKAYSEHQEKQTVDTFTNLLGSTSTTSSGATRRMSTGPISTLRISGETIDRTYSGTDSDRDIGIRTMLGEAGGEGEIGLAAVAHVMKNRQGDSRWGGTISSVALAKNQFSAWNTKPGMGGISRIRSMSADEPAYQKAGLIYDAVMAGKTADPTNGATHYYAPKGMGALVASGAAANVVPAWARAEGAKNEVRIGNHVFSGKAGGGVSQARIGPAPARFGLPGVVSDRTTQAAPGVAPEATEEGIPAKPVTAETERQTQLLEGSIKPENDADRAYLKTSGGGSAGGVKNGTTVDVMPGADPNAVASAQGVPTQQPRNSSQVRELILGYNGLKPEKKAAAVADAMRRQLATGDDTMFNDAGGIGILRELGATPADIDETLKAHKEFEKQQLGKYNASFEKERSQFIADAGSGKFSDDELIARNTDFRRRNLLNDASAQSLIREALSRSATAKSQVSGPDSAKGNLEFQDDMVTVFRGLTLGLYDARQTSEAIKDIAKYHKVPQNEVESLIVRAYSDQEGAWKKQENEALAAAARAREQQVVKDNVNAILSKGYGLSSATGKVTVTDPKSGAETEITAQQYGVRQIEERTVAMVADQVKNKSLDPNMAGPTVEKIKFAALAKQGVIDEEFKNYLTGSLTGDIIDPKTGRPNDGARAAFDLFLRIGKHPNVGPEYMGQYLSTEAKALITTAEDMYDGRLDPESALLKAHQLINDKNRDPAQQITRDQDFNGKAQIGISKAIDEAVGTDSWLKFFAGSVKFSADDIRELKANSKPMENNIYSRASKYRSQFPTLPDKTIIKMATRDAAADFVPVKGGMLYGNSERRERLDQVMGVESYGKDKPMELIDAFVKEQGPIFWKGLYTEQTQSQIGEAASILGRVTRDGSPILSENYQSRYGRSLDGPKYGVTYLPDKKTIGITLYGPDKDGDKTPRGPTMWVRADQLGERFMQKERQPSVAANVWDTITRGVADTLYGNRKNSLVKQGYTQEEIDNPEGFRQRKK